MKLFKKRTAGMKQYKEFKKCIGMIGKIEESDTPYVMQLEA